MTATLMCQSDTDTPKTAAVIVILAGHRLVIVRHDDPKPVAAVEYKLGRSCSRGEMALMKIAVARHLRSHEHAPQFLR